MNKNLKRISQGAFGFFALLGATTHAQTINEVVIEGTVDSFNNYYYQNSVPEELLSATTFRFVVEEDTSASVNYEYENINAYAYKQYQNPLQSISYQFFDVEGNEIAALSVPGFELSLENMTSSYSYFQESFSQQYSHFAQWWADGSVDADWVNLGGYIQDEFSTEDVFTTYVPYPLLTSRTASASYFFGWFNYSSSEQGYQYLEFNGTVTSIAGCVADADGDGFADDIDACSVSLMDESVMFGGWLDSGVTNHVDASGCTVMDHYAACQPAEQEETSRFSRFQPRYSGPSYCEKQVSYELNGDGVIDYTEARMLRDALYMSYRSQPK